MISHAKSKAASRDRRHQRNYLKTLARGLRVMSAFTPDQPTLTLSALASQLSLDPGTMFRFVYTLEYLGYLRREPESGAYRLTSRVLELGRSVHQNDELRSAALPFMEELARATEETVSLAVRDGLDILVVAQVESRRPVTVRGWLGERQPTYCTAQGKTLLAYLPPAEQEQLLAALKLEAYGPRTITDRAALQSELRQTAQRGYALNNDEMDAGLRAVAAPVFSHSGAIIAALSIDAPVTRISLQDLRSRFAGPVMECAAAISRALSYTPNGGHSK